MPRKRPALELMPKEQDLARDLTARGDLRDAALRARHQARLDTWLNTAVLLPLDVPSPDNLPIWTTPHGRPDGRRLSRMISERLAQADAVVDKHGWRLARAVRYIVVLHDHGMSAPKARAAAQRNQLTQEQRALVDSLLRAGRDRRMKNKRR